MIYWFGAYILSSLADLWTTDRAFRRHDNAYEANPLYRKLFGRQLRRSHMLTAKVVWIAFWLGMIYLGMMPPQFLLLPIAGHLYAAVNNYRQEKKQ